MHHIDEYRKAKIVELFLSGATYDEIAEQLGVAKGTVVNVIDDFRNEGLHLLAKDAAYLDSLRKVAVDLRKSGLSVSQMKQYLQIHSKLRELRVGPDEIGDWLDMYRGTASPQSADAFKEAALELAKLERSCGANYDKIIDMYKARQQQLAQVEGEISKTQTELKELKTKISKTLRRLDVVKGEVLKIEQKKVDIASEQATYLTKHQLSWERIKTVEGILNTECSKAGLEKEDLANLRKRIYQVASLAKVTKGLEQTRLQLTADVAGVQQQKEQAVMQLNDALRKQQQAEQRMTQLVGESLRTGAALQFGKSELSNIQKSIAEKKECLYVSDIMLAAVFSQQALSNYALDKLVSILLASRRKRFGIEPNVVTDGQGKVVCQCYIPTMSIETPPMNTDDLLAVRQALALAIRYLISEQFVPRSVYDFEVFGKEMRAKFSEVDRLVNEFTRKRVV